MFVYRIAVLEHLGIISVINICDSSLNACLYVLMYLYFNINGVVWNISLIRDLVFTKIISKEFYALVDGHIKFYYKIYTIKITYRI